MIRLFFGLVLTFLVNSSFSSASFAADTAERNIIGFSADGVWFAFEEFGSADGTGAPYSNIYVININNDKWAKGTPIKTQFGEKIAPISVARKKAMKRASPILSKLKITEPGILLASKPVTEVSPNPRRVDFYRNRALNAPANKLSYVLKELDFPTSKECEAFGFKGKGFSLSFTKGGAPLAEIYKDDSIPSSRHCPQNYTISDVIEFDPENGATRHIVLIHMFSMGFEGADSRYLAVPVFLP